jgi:5-methylcytosine-specific restriction endonuclease McrA
MTLARGMWRHVARRKLFRQQGGQCCWCGKPMILKRSAHLSEMYATLEHLVPLSAGGDSKRENLALSHRKCNQERGAKRMEPLLLRVASQADGGDEHG